MAPKKYSHFDGESRSRSRSYRNVEEHFNFDPTNTGEPRSPSRRRVRLSGSGVRGYRPPSPAPDPRAHPSYPLYRDRAAMTANDNPEILERESLRHMFTMYTESELIAMIE